MRKLDFANQNPGDSTSENFILQTKNHVIVHWNTREHFVAPTQVIFHFTNNENRAHIFLHKFYKRQRNCQPVSRQETQSQSRRESLNLWKRWKASGESRVLQLQEAGGEADSLKVQRSQQSVSRFTTISTRFNCAVTIMQWKVTKKGNGIIQWYIMSPKCSWKWNFENHFMHYFHMLAPSGKHVNKRFTLKFNFWWKWE